MTARHENTEISEDDIDNERLIDEVECRPLLFNKNLKEYSDINAKCNAREEVCVKLFQMWAQLSAKEKTNAGKLVKKRWKNIRTCFARELREQKSTKSGQAAKNRRKYKFFDKLLFLIPSMETRQTTVNVELEEHDGHGSGENENSNEDRVCQRPRKEKKKEKKYSYEDKLLEILKNKEKQPNNTSDDRETHFALSLVPLLKSVLEEKSIDIQIEILQIFKRIQQHPLTSQTYQPDITGGQRKIVICKDQICKPRRTDARYTIIKPRPDPSLLLSTTNSTIKPLGSPMSLPSTSAQNQNFVNLSSLPLPPSSLLNYSVTSPDSNDNDSMHSYYSNFVDDGDDSETYDVCFNYNNS